MVQLTVSAHLADSTEGVLLNNGHVYVDPNGRQKRKRIPRNTNMCGSGEDLCQADGCGRTIAIGDMLRCQGPACNGVVSDNLLFH